MELYVIQKLREVKKREREGPSGYIIDLDLNKG